jgi:predicted restriction endonuclease
VKVVSFKDWLIEIGKSDRTATSYAGAISGAISNWANDAGLYSGKLDDFLSVETLLTISAGLENYPTFKEQNKRGKSMYSSALKAYIDYRRQESSEEVEHDIRAILDDKAFSETEKATYVSARIGQGKYRGDLIEYWGRCALTGFRNVRFLVASHIKPWRSSDHKERLDPYNGLLLLPNIDKAFDLGYISFANKGKIIVSEHLEEPHKLCITRDMRVKLEDRHLEYMEFHRDVVFERFDS